MLLHRDTPPNWREVILDFLRWRWQLKTIAEALGISRSTLGGWWYDGHEPGYSDGAALLKLHSLEEERHRRRMSPLSRIFGGSEKRQSDTEAPETALLSASRAHGPFNRDQETDMGRAKAPRTTRKPGEDPRAAGTPAAQAGQSDPDAAIAAGSRGGTHKVTKPRPATPASKVKGDPERPKSAAVNAKPEISYAEAMALKAEGKLVRSVLTAQGWVTVDKVVPAGAKI